MQPGTTALQSCIDRSKLIGAVLNEATLSQRKYYHYYTGSSQSPNPTHEGEGEAN